MTQPVYITAVPAPLACVILFPGGSGIVAQVRNNFILRRAPLCRGRMTVAVIDTPSDHPRGMGAQARGTADYVTEITAVVALLKSRSTDKIPTMVPGTAMPIRSTVHPQ